MIQHLNEIAPERQRKTTDHPTQIYEYDKTVSEQLVIY